MKIFLFVNPIPPGFFFFNSWAGGGEGLKTLFGKEGECTTDNYRL